ncbi:hypothetical protein [Algoriphagus sp. CAU 1675]|uniref:hypothetical protein n=1 Tax=Algoriphagus sp. CAU 1675 TaxID=3032597 RepID=UPI0023DC4910|nr:hypothetical protein [Algoriphagus sp. CAU 1675]MDF2158937.1 hypothetical protein [Algoriphagus sp. CAU 1675]
MKTFTKIFGLAFTFLLLAFEGFGQRVYTLNGSCAIPSLTNSSCWNVSGSCGSGTAPGTNLVGTSSCPIQININQSTTISGDLTLGGYVTINVTSGATLTVTGKIDVVKETSNNTLNLNGGNINGGSLLLPSGKSTAKTQLAIDGDGNGLLEVGSLTVNQQVVLDILAGGSLFVSGLTKYAGNSSQINVYGSYETNGLEISGGGRGVELNAFGDAVVTISGDVDIVGESTITFGGNSSVLIEGDLRVTGNFDENSLTGGLILTENTSVTVSGNIDIDGNAAIIMENDAELLAEGNVYISGSGELNMSDSSTIIVEGGCGTYEDTSCLGGLFIVGNGAFNEYDTSKAYICGKKPDPNTGGTEITTYCDPNDPSLMPGVNCALYTSCRILSVEFVDFKVSFDQENRKNFLVFSTSSEKDNSHFEIERSTDGTKTFTKLGVINGSGWAESLTEYHFEDTDLPVGGGNIFYRIKQFDFNGDFIYSKIIANRIPSVGFTSGVWRAYPNPSVGNQLRLGLLNPSQYNGESISVRVIHSLNITDTFTASDLGQINSQLGSWINQIPSGLLVVEIVWGDKIDHIKVLKR